MCSLWISGHQLLESFHGFPLLMLVELLNYVQLVQLLTKNISCWEHLFVMVCNTALPFMTPFDTDSFLCFFFKAKSDFSRERVVKSILAGYLTR